MILMIYPGCEADYLKTCFRSNDFFHPDTKRIFIDCINYSSS